MLGYRNFSGGSGAFSGGRNFDPTTNAFDIQNVSPGHYSVQVQLPLQPLTVGPGPIDPARLTQREFEQASLPSAEVPIDVVDADIDNIVLTLSSGVTVAGRVVVEDHPVSAVPRITAMRLLFNTPAESGRQTPIATPIAEDGTFRVDGLREAEYRVRFPIGGDFYVRSIQYGGDEILGKPFKFNGSGTGIFQVTLRRGTARVSGFVTDSKAQPVPGIQVVFVPSDRNRFDLLSPALTDQNGHFSIVNLVPGQYKVFSWEVLENNAFFDPEFLRRYEQQGKAVSIAESSNSNIDVRLIPR
jgi:hypothetical protein